MTNLCVLQTGENNPKIQAHMTTNAPVPGYADLFRDLFAPYPNLNLEFIQIRNNEFPDDINKWDAFLITGSPAGAYDDFEWIAPLEELIRSIVRAGKPLVGICFGHQIIAQALGGKVVKSDKGWGIGVRDVALHDEGPPIASKNNTSLSLIYFHQDQVIEPPQGATVFAGDDFCPIAGYTIGDSVLTFQGHPEFTPELAEAIMQFRVKSIDVKVADEARTTLGRPHDGMAVADAIVNFISTSKQTSTPRPKSSVA